MMALVVRSSRIGGRNLGRATETRATIPTLSPMVVPSPTTCYPCSPEDSISVHNQALISRRFSSTLRDSFQRQRRQVNTPTPLLQLHSTARRWNWEVVLRRRWNPATRKVQYEDWDSVVFQIQEPTKQQDSDGGIVSGGRNRGSPDGVTTVSLLERHLQQEEHIKPTELNRRLNSAKIYKRSVKRVNDLTKYIQFVHRQEEEEDGKAGSTKK